MSREKIFKKAEIKDVEHMEALKTQKDAVLELLSNNKHPKVPEGQTVQEFILFVRTGKEKKINKKDTILLLPCIEYKSTLKNMIMNMKQLYTELKRRRIGR